MDDRFESGSGKVKLLGCALQWNERFWIPVLRLGLELVGSSEAWPADGAKTQLRHTSRFPQLDMAMTASLEHTMGCVFYL